MHNARYAQYTINHESSKQLRQIAAGILLEQLVALC